MSEDPRREGTKASQEKIPKAQLISLTIVGATLIVIVVGLEAYVRPSDPTEKKDFVQAIGVLLAGLVGFGGLYFTWRNLNQTRQVAQRTLELTERGQITERFTRAIDQLGATDDKSNKRLELRLGGIYALERIARDSDEDHWPIMEVLTAYVRTQASRNPEEEYWTSHLLERLPEILSEILSLDEHARDGDIRDLYRALVIPPELDLPPEPDIQAILTVIGRRIRHLRHGEPEPLDLQKTDLAHSSALQGANLQGAVLQGAVLQGANLQGANLQGAFFYEALGLRQEQLEKTFGNRETWLPPYLRHPDSWNRSEKADECQVKITKLQEATESVYVDQNAEEDRADLIGELDSASTQLNKILSQVLSQGALEDALEDALANLQSFRAKVVALDQQGKIGHEDAVSLIEKGDETIHCVFIVFPETTIPSS